MCFFSFPFVTSQQESEIVMLSSCVRLVTMIDHKDQNSRTLAGRAAYRQEILHVYLAAGVELSVLLGP